MTPASIRVQMGDSEIHQISPGAQLMEARVTHEVNQHSTCFLAYRQSPDLVFDLTRFHRAIFWVYAVLADGTEFLIFEGTVEDARQKHQISGAIQLFLTGFGHTKRFDQNRFQTYKLGSTLQEKMDEMTKRAHAMVNPRVVATNPDIEPFTSFTGHDYQLGETDWIHLLAEISDRRLMLVSDPQTNLFARDHFETTDTTLRLNQEGGLISFEVRSQLIPAMRRGVNYDPFDFKSKVFAQIQDDLPRLGAASSVCDYAKKQNSFDQGARAEVTLKREVQAQDDLKADARRAFGQSVRGAGESREVALSVGRTVTLEGSDSFAGKWGIIRLVHVFSPSTGYFNEFECTPFDTGECVPAIEVRLAQSFFTGRVISTPKKQADTNGDRFAIQVQFPWEETAERSRFWPWLAPSAGTDRGFCFPPEIGDEVLVQFHDESTAFIISAAWNGKEFPPLQDLHGKEVQNNDIKRLVTKSGNRLVMDDKEGKETIVVATPKHVRVSLFDGGSTLVLHSDGDIHINAGGTVHMKCHQFLREVG